MYGIRGKSSTKDEGTQVERWNLLCAASSEAVTRYVLFRYAISLAHPIPMMMLMMIIVWFVSSREKHLEGKFEALRYCRMLCYLAGSHFSSAAVKTIAAGSSPFSASFLFLRFGGVLRATFPFSSSKFSSSSFSF